MQRRTLLAVSAAALAGCGAEAGDTLDTTAAARRIRARINDVRARVGVGALEPSGALQTAAQAHSRDMHARDFYGHENPDGEQPWDRVACQADEAIHRGEVGRMQNIDSEQTWNAGTTDGLAGYVVEGWELSRPHRETITDDAYARVGVGVAVRDAEWFATAMFCR